MEELIASSYTRALKTTKPLLKKFFKSFDNEIDVINIELAKPIPLRALLIFEKNHVQIALKMMHLLRNTRLSHEQYNVYVEQYAEELSQSWKAFFPGSWPYHSLDTVHAEILLTFLAWRLAIRLAMQEDLLPKVPGLLENGLPVIEQPFGTFLTRFLQLNLQIEDALPVKFVY